MRDRQTVQRADAAAVRQILIRQARALHRLLGHERDDRVDRRIHALDLHQVRADHITRG